MTWTSNTITINVRVDALWEAVSAFGAIELYLPKIVSCQASGDGPGALRTLTSPDGGVIVERLESLNHADRRLTFSLLTDTPFHNCLTTLHTYPIGSSQSALEWTVSFEPDGLPEGEAVALLASALAADSLSFKRSLEA